ncbi:MAG TPA: putative porin [Nitrospiria bacterium]
MSGRGIGVLIVTGLLLFPGAVHAAEDLIDVLVKKGTITKAEAEALQSRSVSSAVDKITFYGDLRVREETQWYNGDGNDAKNKNRQRFRLRIGADIEEGPLQVHVRLASGTGEQVSANQTMQKLSSQKGIWIDRAYVEYLGVPGLNLAAGRMANPFFTNFTSELIWDDDYNPEGLIEQYTMKTGDQGRLFARAGQIILDGGDAGGAAQWLLVYQAGAEIKTAPAGFNLALTYYSLANSEKTNFNQVTTQDGNTRVGCNPPSAETNCLANPYNVISATAAVTVPAGRPLTLSADVVKNLVDTVQNPMTDDENLGYEIGLKFGNATAAHTSEVGYSYRSMQTDAALADINDSDFGPNGGTNRKGHVVWAAYNPTKATQFKLKYFNTRVENPDLPPAPVSATPGGLTNPTHQRIQIDFSVKF